MRKKRQKNRCIKMKLDKCPDLCRAYDKIQEAFARMLSVDENVDEYNMNVPLDFALIKDLEPPTESYMTDFVIRWKSGTIAVRECVFRRALGYPSTAENLQLSKAYWQQKGVSDWGIIIEIKET